MEKFPFNATFQQAVIKIMLKDDEFLEHCSLYLEDDFFENIYLGWLFGKVCQFRKEYGKSPSIESIHNEISKFPSDKRHLYSVVFEKVLSCDYDDEEYIRNELTRFAKSAIFVKEQHSVISHYNAGNMDKAFNEVQRIGERISEIDFSNSDFVDFDNMESILDMVRSENANKVKLGIEAFDKEMNGGVANKTFVVFLGATNVGKSVILTQQAVNLMRQGKKVCYIDVEMSEEVVFTRFLSCLTGININRLARNEKLLLEEERQKIREAKPILKEYLILKTLHEESLFIEDALDKCRAYKRKYGFDVLIIDYGQAMTTKEKHISGWERHGEVHRKMSRFALGNDCIVITAAQAKAEGQKISRNARKATDLLRMEDISGAFEIVRKAGVVITITKSDRDQANNRIKFLLDKQRLGRTNIAVSYHTDFDSMQVFGPHLECEPVNLLEDEKDAD